MAAEGEELIVPDYSELNAMRAQPVFVTLALNTLLDRPQSCDRDPHICVGYLNDLIAMDGVDYITSTALQCLLRDRAFRAALYRGLASKDEHKLFKALQLLKRCIGGGPGMLGGFHRFEHALSPPWSLKELLELEAEQPLVAACNTVAAMVEQHTVERQLLGLLHTTLLDIFDLLYVDDEGDESGTEYTAHIVLSGASVGACGGAAGSAHCSPDKQPAAAGNREAAAEGDSEAAAAEEKAAAGDEEGEAAVVAGRRAASAAPAGCGSSAQHVAFEWPDALVAAHAALVIQVAKHVPFLITCIPRMHPYKSSAAATAALEAMGPDSVMTVLLEVLAAGDPTDWLMLQHEVDSFKVVDALVQRSPKLALAALQAGAPRVICAALLQWASFLPISFNPASTDPDICSEPEQQHEDHAAATEDAAAHLALAETTSSSPNVDGCDQAGPNASSSTADADTEATTPTAAAPEAPAAPEAAVVLPFDQPGSRFVDPHVSGAAAAALKLLRTLLRAATAAAAGPDSSRPDNVADQAGSSSSKSSGPAEASLEPNGTAAAAAAAAAGQGPCKGVCDVPEELPQLLVELGHIGVLQPAAAECLAELELLGLVPAGTGGRVDAAGAAAADAGACSDDEGGSAGVSQHHRDHA